MDQVGLHFGAPDIRSKSQELIVSSAPGFSSCNWQISQGLIRLYDLLLDVEAWSPPSEALELYMKVMATKKSRMDVNTYLSTPLFFGASLLLEVAVAMLPVEVDPGRGGAVTETVAVDECEVDDDGPVESRVKVLLVSAETEAGDYLSVSKGHQAW